jgi:hypothetical protein
MTKKGSGKGAGFPFRRDLSFFHCFEQRALSLGRGAIDLVGQDQLGKDGSWMEVKAAAVAVEDRDAENVCRQHVAGELNALKIQAQHPGQYMGQGGLADARQVFDEQVPARQQAGERETDGAFLAKDDAVDVGKDGIKFRGSHGVGIFSGL